MIDDKILEVTIKTLTKSFDEYIKATMDENGKPITQTMKDLMRARACIPSGYKTTLEKEKK